MTLAPDLVAQLRRRLKDERVGRTAFRVSCTDTAATDCMLSIDRAGKFTTTPLNARVAAALSYDLIGDASVQTVRQLFEIINSKPGYTASLERDYEAGHPAADLQLISSASCLNNAVPLRHHIWSDDELEELVRRGAQRHNVRYTPSTVPVLEEVFVLALAEAEAYRDLAGDAAKRAGLDYTAEQLLELSNNLEVSYRADVARNARVLPVAKPLDEAEPGRGEIITSNSYRRNNRTGWMAPIGASLPPIAVELKVDEVDIEDTRITLRWTRNRDMQFYAYELWRDTRPNVQRPDNVILVTDVPTVEHDNLKKQYTSVLAMRSAGPHSIAERVGTIAILSEQGGQTLNAFTDTGYSASDPRGLGPATAPPLEPGATYYYKMFVVGLNDTITPSNEVCVTTKPQRPAFASTNSILPTSGAMGSTVTITGTGFVSGMIVTLNGKVCTGLVINSPTSASFVVPTFTNRNILNLRCTVVIQDPNTGLIDVLANGYMITS